MPPTKEEMDAFFERSAQTYEDSVPFMRFFAEHVVTELPAIDGESVVHDNACGPGIVSSVIVRQSAEKKMAMPSKLYATDFSPAMIRQFQRKPDLKDVDAEVMDSTSLRFADGTFSHSATNFALMLIGDDPARAAAREIYRTLQPGGTAALTTWASLGYLHMFTEMLAVVRPDAKLPPGIPVAEHWKTEETLVDTLVQGGFERKNISVTQVPHEVTTGLKGRPEVLMNLKKLIIDRVIAGWSDEEKEQFAKAFEDRVTREQDQPTAYTMVAHVAIAKK